MSYRKRSDRAIDYGLTRFWKGLRNAHYTRTTVRTLMLTFGLSLSIFFPMLEMSQSPSTPGSASKGDTGDQGVVGSRGERGPTGDRGPEGGLSGDAYNTIYEGFVGPIYARIGDIDKRIDKLGTGETVVKVMANGLNVVSIPPISVQWHRAAFENIGDMFWAIPNRDLTIVLRTNDTPCTLSACKAEFEVSSDTYVVPESRLVLDDPIGSRIDQHMVPPKFTDEKICSVKRDNRYHFLYCLFKPRSSTNTKDPEVCMHIRRSFTAEVRDDEKTELVALDVRDDEKPELVALDVRWAEVPPDPGAVCVIGKGSPKTAKAFE